MVGANVAPTIEPVAKITAELAPVSACAAASRSTLPRARASLVISSVAVVSSMRISARRAPAGSRAYFIAGDYETGKQRDQPAQTGLRHAPASPSAVRHEPLDASSLRTQGPIRRGRGKGHTVRRRLSDKGRALAAELHR